MADEPTRLCLKVHWPPTETAKARRETIPVTDTEDLVVLGDTTPPPHIVRQLTVYLDGDAASPPVRVEVHGDRMPRLSLVRLPAGELGRPTQQLRIGDVDPDAEARDLFHQLLERAKALIAALSPVCTVTTTSAYNLLALRSEETLGLALLFGPQSQVGKDVRLVVQRAKGVATERATKSLERLRRLLEDARAEPSTGLALALGAAEALERIQDGDEVPEMGLAALAGVTRGYVYTLAHRGTLVQRREGFVDPVSAKNWLRERGIARD